MGLEPEKWGEQFAAFVAESGAPPVGQCWSSARPRPPSIEGSIVGLCAAFCHEGFSYEGPDENGFVTGGICSFECNAPDTPQGRRTILVKTARYILDRLARGEEGC